MSIHIINQEVVIFLLKASKKAAELKMLNLNIFFKLSFYWSHKMFSCTISLETSSAIFILLDLIMQLYSRYIVA